MLGTIETDGVIFSYITLHNLHPTSEHIEGRLSTQIRRFEAGWLGMWKFACVCVGVDECHVHVPPSLLFEAMHGKGNGYVSLSCLPSRRVKAPAFTCCMAAVNQADSPYISCLEYDYFSVKPYFQIAFFSLAKKKLLWGTSKQCFIKSVFMGFVSFTTIS